MHPTLRSLEQTLGLSRTTISKALRGSPFVRESTAERIRLAAAAAGYERNPLAGAVMSEQRRSRGELFRGVLALLDQDEQDRPGYAGRFHQELVRGAEERARMLGFKIERFVVGPRALPLRRVNQILQSRDIRGVLLLPTWASPDYLNLDWSQYSGIYMDYRIEKPAISCVCCDHFRSMMMALEELLARGYRRPGLILPRKHDARLQHRWAAAFLGFQKLYLQDPVPPLITDPICEENFNPWFRLHQPDVVIGHVEETMAWMKRAGARIPQTSGFFCLNLMNATQPCAGLDQRPHQIGRTAAEIVIASLQRNEHGIPSAYSLTSQPAVFVDGPTVRPRPLEPVTEPQTRKSVRAALR